MTPEGVPVLALLLVGSLAVSAPVPKSVKAKDPPDPERILGAWEVYDSEANVGKGTTTIWTFTEGKMHSSSGNTTWVIRLDPEQTPKHIDITEYKGIYEFDGDKLKIAYTIAAARPGGFTPGNGVYFNLLVKAKEQPGK